MNDVPVTRLLAAAALVIVILSFVVDGPLVAIAVILLAIAMIL